MTEVMRNKKKGNPAVITIIVVETMEGLVDLTRKHFMLLHLNVCLEDIEDRTLVHMKGLVDITRMFLDLNICLEELADETSVHVNGTNRPHVFRTPSLGLPVNHVY